VIGMRILAIDTATPICGVALWVDGRTAVELVVDHGQTHARYLMEAVQAALKLGGILIDQVDGFAVTRGPGSFTGLRIGISTVKGMAMAAGKPVAGVSTLHALAVQAEWGGELVCPLIDARRGEVYWSMFRRNGVDLEILEPEQVGPLAHVLERIDRPCAFVGSGAHAYRSLLLENPYTLLPLAQERHLLRPGGVAQLAGTRFPGGYTDDLSTLGPVYLRPSDAELNRRSSHPMS
jgi:tRNA threonylcarbamoyladenosine biosynthesis protein TsaB